MGANHGGDGEGQGNTHPKLGSNKEKRSNLNHTKLEKFVICPINQAFIQDFDPSRGCWLNPGGVTKSRFQSIASRRSGAVYNLRLYTDK